MSSSECPHGISLDKFCGELHLTSQPHVDIRADASCPHGVALDTFCRELHGGSR